MDGTSAMRLSLAAAMVVAIFAFVLLLILRLFRYGLVGLASASRLLACTQAHSVLTRMIGQYKATPCNSIS